MDGVAAAPTGLILFTRTVGVPGPTVAGAAELAPIGSIAASELPAGG